MLTDHMTIEQLEAEYSQTIVAIVYDSDNKIFDYCFNWNSGQSYAANGNKVVAIKPDGHMSVDDMQRLFDYERRVHDDCFGVNG